MILILIGAVAVLGIVASLVVVSRDGYRRQPTRPLATTYRHAIDAAGTDAAASARPSDLPASQWLHETAPAAGQTRRTQHAAGAMVLRPW